MHHPFLLFEGDIGILYSVHYGFESVVLFFSSRRRHTRLVSDWSSDVCSSDLLRDGDLLDRRVVEEFPIRIFRGPFELLVGEGEAGDLDRTALREAVDAHDPALGAFHQAPFAFPGHGIEVELSQVAFGAGLARVFQEVLERPGKLPRPAHVVPLDRAPVLVARVEKLYFPVSRERGLPDLSGESESQAHESDREKDSQVGKARLPVDAHRYQSA